MLLYPPIRLWRDLRRLRESCSRYPYDHFSQSHVALESFHNVRVHYLQLRSVLTNAYGHTYIHAVPIQLAVGIVFMCSLASSITFTVKLVKVSPQNSPYFKCKEIYQFCSFFRVAINDGFAVEQKEYSVCRQPGLGVIGCKSSSLAYSNPAKHHSKDDSKDFSK